MVYCNYMTVDFSPEAMRTMAKNVPNELKDRLLEVYMDKYGTRELESEMAVLGSENKYKNVRVTDYHDNLLGTMCNILGISKCKLVCHMTDEYYKEKIAPFVSK